MQAKTKIQGVVLLFCRHCAVTRYIASNPGSKGDAVFKNPSAEMNDTTEPIGIPHSNNICCNVLACYRSDLL